MRNTVRPRITPLPSDDDILENPMPLVARRNHVFSLIPAAVMSKMIKSASRIVTQILIPYKAKLATLI